MAQHIADAGIGESSDFDAHPGMVRPVFLVCFSLSTNRDT
jgi:hypothetical protein